MSDELKPCPLACESQNPPYLQQWTRAVGMLTEKIARVACDCGCFGPERYGDNAAVAAVEAWNRRASSWTPTAERMPTEYAPYIVWYTEQRFWDRVWFDPEYPERWAQFSHWQPAPEKP